MGVFGTQPQYLATLFDPNHVSSLDPFALSNMFQLTPAEARVASHMAAGLTAEEISQNNFTAVSTVRTQISQVISKLGAKRTTDVVRMLRQGEALWSTAGQAIPQ
jgi:DNA-binding CsgD family transcriptional regulator